MRGTEKQITWATEIINRIVPVLEQASEDFSGFVPATQEQEEAKRENIEGIEKRIDALKNADYAGDVISLFRSVRVTGNQSEDFSKVLAVYRVSLPCTRGEQEILCK